MSHLSYLDSQSPNGQLLACAAYGDPDTAAFLLAEGASLDYRAAFSDPALGIEEGQRAVDVARKHNNHKMVQLLSGVPLDQVKGKQATTLGTTPGAAGAWNSEISDDFSVLERVAATSLAGSRVAGMMEQTADIERYNNCKSEERKKDEYKKEQSVWSNVNIPLMASEAKRTLRFLIRKGVIDSLRGEVWLAVSGAAEILACFGSEQYEGLNSELPIKSAFFFGGKDEVESHEFFKKTEENKKMYYRLLTLIQADNPALSFAPSLPDLLLLFLLFLSPSACFFLARSLIQTSDIMFTSPFMEEDFALTFVSLIPKIAPKADALFRSRHVDILTLYRSMLRRFFLPLLTLSLSLRMLDIALCDGRLIFWLLPLSLFVSHHDELSTALSMCAPTLPSVTAAFSSVFKKVDDDDETIKRALSLEPLVNYFLAPPASSSSSILPSMPSLSLPAWFSSVSSTAVSTSQPISLPPSLAAIPSSPPPAYSGVAARLGSLPSSAGSASATSSAIPFGKLSVDDGFVIVDKELDVSDPVYYRPLMSSSSTVLSNDEISAFFAHLPAPLQIMDLTLLYANNKHGESMRLMTSKTNAHTPHLLLMVKTLRGDRFGAYLGCGPLRPSGREFFGSRASFVWKVEDGKIKSYKWHDGNNDHIININANGDIYLGGPSPAMFISSDSFVVRSQPCPTFSSPALFNSDDTVQVSVLELWKLD